MMEPQPLEEKKAEAEQPETVPEEKEAESKDLRRWYIIQTLTGHEDKVKANIERLVETAGLQDKIFRVLVPEEETIELKGDKRITRLKKMYPGYVFVEMVLDEKTWYQIRETPGVARFIGGKVEPTPVSDREMQRVLKQIGFKEEKIEVKFEKGESIRVISGPFRGYTGSVDEVNVSRGKIKALISIFGRDTPVEIDFDQAERMI